MISGAPSVLVVDDDAISLGFLGVAIERCGLAVASAASAEAAMALAATRSFELLVIDRGLPDCDGPTLLQRLREAGIRAPAIATSADLTHRDAEALRASGFAATLAKPASLAELQALLGRFVAVAPTEVAAAAVARTAAVLDDGPALAAVGGDRRALSSLRELLAREIEAFAGGSGDDDDRELAGRLHRLRASCGFCGALALAEVAARYESALRSGSARTDVVRREFLAACARTAAALDGARQGA